jgi:putative transposase
MLPSRAVSLSREKRFAIERITTILKRAELGTPAVDLCRKLGIAEQSFHRWKRTYLGTLAK